MFGIDAKANRATAAKAAQRAVQLDPGDAEAHAVLGMSFGHQGQFARAKAELETALRLAPGEAEILTFYSSWASSFGEPARGAALADEVIRLNPNYPMWSARVFAHAYFMAGRYADALHMLERLSPENYSRDTWLTQTGALAALGRKKEAKEAVERALHSFPDLTVKKIANEPDYNAAERQRLIETMRLAGFPA